MFISRLRPIPAVTVTAIFAVAVAVAVGVAAFALALTPPAMAESSGGGGTGGTRSGGSQTSEGRGMDEAQAIYDRGMELLGEGRYQDALKRFEKAHKKRRKDPEILNMVAYTQRKVGRLDDAFETYERVLGMRPDFPQAREYLGEAHIQAVLHQLDVLRGYGADGKRQHDLLVAALREAAQTLTAPPDDGELPVPDKKPW